LMKLAKKLTIWIAILLALDKSAPVLNIHLLQLPPLW